MKVYARNPFPFTFVAGTAGTAASVVSKGWIFAHAHASIARFGLLCLPAVSVFGLIYLGNLAVICLYSPPELQGQIVARWCELDSSQEKPELFGKATDYIDRVASTLVWLKYRTIAIGEGQMDPHGLCPSLVKAELVSKNEELKDEIATIRKERILPLLVELKSIWEATKAPYWDSQAPLYLEDPIYGQIALEPKLFPVFYHPLFQRLNYVRQLSFAYLIFPSASHSRLSHILGVVRNAEVALRRMLDKGWVYTSKGRRQLKVSDTERESLLTKVQLCALLHDIGHGPFGHALDKLIPYLDVNDSPGVPDKVYSVRYVEEFLLDEVNKVAKSAGFDLEDVLNILDKERQTEIQGFDGLILDLIDSPLDVDRMDYLVRDAHMTGLGMGHSNVQALIERMCPYQHDDGYVNLTYDEEALPHLEHIIYTRDIMYINCYEHARKVCAERVLARLAQYLLGLGLKKDDLMVLTDEQLLDLASLLTTKGSPEGLLLKSLRENSPFKVCREYRLSVYDPETNRTVFNENLREEVKGWRDRRISGGHELKSVFISTPRDWEEQICGNAGLSKPDFWKVVVTVPAFDAKQEKETPTRVLVRDGNGYKTQDLYDASPVMRAEVTNLKPMREVIRVIVVAELAERSVQDIGDAADCVFMRS